MGVELVIALAGRLGIQTVPRVERVFFRAEHAVLKKKILKKVKCDRVVFFFSVLYFHSCLSRNAHTHHTPIHISITHENTHTHITHHTSHTHTHLNLTARSLAVAAGLDRNWSEITHAKVLLVKLLREAIAVIQQHITVENKQKRKMHINYGFECSERRKRENKERVERVE